VRSGTLGLRLKLLSRCRGSFLAITIKTAHVEGYGDRLRIKITISRVGTTVLDEGCAHWGSVDRGYRIRVITERHGKTNNHYKNEPMR